MAAVSVIVPVYEKKEYLERCVKSVQGVCAGEAEILCIDDGSTDGSRELLYAMQKQDTRIRVIENHENKGAAYSRNRGIAYAEGKYLLFLDADDYLEKGALDACLHRLEETGADGCFLNLCEGPSGEPSIKGSYEGVYSGPGLMERFAGNDESFLYACGAAWRTDYIRGNRLLFQDLKIGEGGLFILEALQKAGRVAFCREAVYRYEVNETSVNRKKEAMAYAAAGQAKQIAYMLCQLGAGEEDRETVAFLAWYLKKHIGGIQNLKGLEEAGADRLFSGSERFLFDLIRGVYSGDMLALPQEEEALIRKAGRVYLYGAGYETLPALRCCNRLGAEVVKIFVSSKEGNPDTVYGFRICEFGREIPVDKEIPFLITAHKKHHGEIRERLLQAGVRYILNGR